MSANFDTFNALEASYEESTDTLTVVLSRTHSTLVDPGETLELYATIVMNFSAPSNTIKLDDKGNTYEFSPDYPAAVLYFFARQFDQIYQGLPFERSPARVFEKPFIFIVAL